MSSAAKAKPVVLGVGLADAGGSEGDGSPGAGDADPAVVKGDATGLGLKTLGPQAASSSAAAATTIEAGRR